MGTLANLSGSGPCPICEGACGGFPDIQALGEGLGKEVVVPTNPDTFTCPEPVWRDGVLVHAKGAAIAAAEARRLGLVGEDGTEAGGRARRPVEDRAHRPQEDR